MFLVDSIWLSLVVFVVVLFFLFLFLNHLDNLRLLIGIFRLNWNIAVARVRLNLLYCCPLTVGF